MKINNTTSMKSMLPTFFFLLVTLINLKGQSDTVKYLELSYTQLKDIGFVINDRGIFFKSVIPDSDNVKGFKTMVGYLNTKEEQGTRSRWGDAKTNFDEIKKDNTNYFDSLPVLNSDYYFIKIIDENGDNIYTSIWKKVETIPILVRQSDYNFKIKKDIIVYLKASVGLKKKLNYISNLDKYIVTLSEK